MSPITQFGGAKLSPEPRHLLDSYAARLSTHKIDNRAKQRLAEKKR